MKLLSEIKEKHCPKCKADKILDEFYNSIKSKDGKYYICKICTEIQRKKPLLLFDKEEDLDSYSITETKSIGLPIFTENKEQLTAIGRVEEHKGVKYLILPSRV